MIRFACACGRQLQAPEHLAGRAAVCPVCGQNQVVPDADVAVQPVPVGAGQRQPPRPGRERETPSTAGRKRRSPRGKAVASLVLGLLALPCVDSFRWDSGLFGCLGFAASLAAVVLGVWVQVDLARSPGRRQGRWVALLGVAAGLLGLVLPFASTSRQGGIKEAPGRTQSINNLKQIGLAMHAYLDEHGRFPPSAIRGPDGKPLLSWRVALLPYLEQQALYKQFRLDEPWDGPTNRPLLERMPKTYKSPGKEDPAGMTRYQVFVGPGTAFESPEGHRVADFVDGLTNTVLAVEADNPVPWTKPEDIPYHPLGSLPPLNTRGWGHIALFADGTVRSIRKDTPEAVRRAIITRNGGEQVEAP